MHDALPALKAAQRAGLDLDSIVSAFCARSRYGTHRVLRVKDCVALLEFDLIIDRLAQRQPADV